VEEKEVGIVWRVGKEMAGTGILRVEGSRRSKIEKIIQHFIR